MNAEIISIGTELLLGQIVDTNSAWIAQQLAAQGVNLFRTQTVGDNQQRAAQAIREALERADLVITTGGLGPTVDDVTPEAIAEATGRRLVRDPALVARVEAIFARWGRRASSNNLRQADLPEGAEALPNPIGTAPGVLLELPNGKMVVAVPGVPREMKRMISEQLLPRLSERGVTAVIKVKLLRTAAIGESALDNLIEELERSDNPTVGLAAHTGRVDVRVTARAATEGEADRLLAHMAEKVRRRAGNWIFGEDDETLEGVVARLLNERGESMVCLETQSRGRYADALREAGAPVAGVELADPGALPSEEEARRQATTLSETHGAPWALALFSTAKGHAYEGETGESLIVVTGPAHAESLRYAQSGADEMAEQWLLSRALMLLRKVLIDSNPQ